MVELELGKLKIGDKIIDFGRVYRVFKISCHKTPAGEKRVIHFRPYFKRSGNRSLVCTIPEESLLKTNIRRPVGSGEARVLLRKISTPAQTTKGADLDWARQVIAENDLASMVDFLKYLYYGRKREEKDFTTSQKRIINSLINRIAGEVGLALRKKPEQVRESINCNLKKGLKIKPKVS
ncbi:MAG: hypothetical protein PHX72_00395 [Candidatus Shapirobacteria bacterium]|nr:hypothetical protein [Candidatus Shapirobacteria bacterium]